MAETFNPWSMSPQQMSDQIMEMNATPAGQAAMRGRDQTASLNREQVMSQMKSQRDQIAVQKGTAEANAWYQKQQIKVMMDDHAIRRESMALDESFRRDEMGLNESFRRDELGVNSTFKAAELGSNLRGPRDWAAYLEAANQVAGSGIASPLLASQPGIGPMQAGFNPQKATLGSVLGDFGFGASPFAAGGATGTGSGGPTNSALGLTDADAQQLKTYFRNPNQAPAAWWVSKNEPQREYLRGLSEQWGHDPNQWESSLSNNRPSQGSPLAAY